MVIELNENTARQLLEAANSEGMTVEEFVRTHLLLVANAKNTGRTQSVTGAMAADSDLLDEIVIDAFAARARDPLRVETDE